MNKKATAEPTLQDLSQLLNMWEAAYLRLPLEPAEDLELGMQTVTQYLAVVLGNLYMRRLISLEDMQQMSTQAVAGYTLWARLSFGIGLEAGLGRIKAADVQPYLRRCSQPYMQSLLQPRWLLRNRTKVGEGRRGPTEAELGSLIHNMSVLLANSGYASGRSMQTGNEQKLSPVVEFFRDIDAMPNPQRSLDVETPQRSVGTPLAELERVSV